MHTSSFRRHWNWTFKNRTIAARNPSVIDRPRTENVRSQHSEFAFIGRARLADNARFIRRQCAPRKGRLSPKGQWPAPSTQAPIHDNLTRVSVCRQKWKSRARTRGPNVTFVRLRFCVDLRFVDDITWDGRVCLFCFAVSLVSSARHVRDVVVVFPLRIDF